MNYSEINQNKEIKARLAGLLSNIYYLHSFAVLVTATVAGVSLSLA